MSEDRITSGIEPAEEVSATDGEQDSNRCFQVSALCCCVPRRQMSLRGRKPKERKKKKNAGGLSFSDIMLEEELDQACWNISAGDHESVQIDAIKPTLSLCPQAYGTKDHCIPLPIGTFYLEEKQKDCDEKPGVKSFQKQGEVTKPSKEGGLNDLGVLCSEMEKKSVEAAGSEGLPSEKGTSYQVVPGKENRQTGRPELPDALLQEVAHEKEQQEGGDHASIISETVSCKKVYENEKQEQQATPFQELEQGGKREDLKSPLLNTEIKIKEEEDNNSTDYESATSLKEVLIQSWIPCSEELQPWGQQQLAKDVAHKVEEQVIWDKVKAVPKEDTYEKAQRSPDTLYQEVRQPVELKYPDSLPVMDKNHEQEQSDALHLVDIVSETSEHKYKEMVDQEVQRPFKAKATSYLFQDTAYEKEEEVQSVTHSASDSTLSKAEEHQCNPHQVNIQAVVEENKTTFQPEVTCAMEQQKLAPMNDMLENALGYTPEQNMKHILLAELASSTHHHSISHEKEPQEGPDHLYSGFQGFPEEQENPELIISEMTGTLPDNLSYEKEQQRKLEGGDSGSESLYDKDEQDCPAAIFLEGQAPLVLEQLSSIPLDRTSEAGQGARNSGTLETHFLEEQQVECGNQSKTFLSVSSKEAKDGQEEQETITFASTLRNMEGEEMEAWRTPDDTFMPHKEQPQKDQFDLGMTCEEQQRKGKQGLSEARFFHCTRRDEEKM